MNSAQVNFAQKMCFVAFVPLLPFWCFLAFSGTSDSSPAYFFGLWLALIPLAGGAYMLPRIWQWGGFKSVAGKMVFFLSVGLVLWGCGGLVWSYYNFFLDVAVPYPSLADLGYAPGMIFYWIAGFYLAQITGATFALKSTSAKIMTIFASICVALFSYYILVVVAHNGVLFPHPDSFVKTLLDILYPVGDFISLLLAVVITGLSYKYIGGRHMLDTVSILAGLAVMFVADALFSYSTTMGTYYNGHPTDLFLATGMFLLTFGLLGFREAKVRSE